MGSSLVTRLTLLYAVLTAAVVAVFGLLLYRGNREQVIADHLARLDHTAELVEVKLTSAVAAIVDDAVYLARSPPVQALAGAGGGGGGAGATAEIGALPGRVSAAAAKTKTRVEEDFSVLLRVRPSYTQVRLIGVADGGREVIRIDRADGVIAATPPGELQQKGGRDYFRASLRLRPGEAYLSEINLNRERGLVSQPHMPTLRAAAPVFDASGERFGFVVVNVDIRFLFRELERFAARGEQLYLGNAEGDFLLHPDPGLTFGFDTGRRHRLADEFPGLRRHPVAPPPPFPNSPGGRLAVFRSFRINPQHGGVATLALAYPREVVLGGIEAVRNRSIGLTVIIALAAVALMLLATRLLARRIGRLAEAIDAYRPGHPAPQVSSAGSDEVAALARGFDQMAGQINSQIEALEQARAQAEAATHEKEFFLATMSHEIRTPLNAVIGMARMLEENRPEPHQEPIIDTLRFSAQNLLALLNDVLDFAKVNSGTVEFARVDFDLHEVLGNSFQSHRTEAAAAGTDYRLEVAEGLPRRVRGDPVRLYQVLNNLLGNALRHTGPGRVTLSAAPAPSGTSGAGLDNGRTDEVHFRVRDTGRGIERAEIERIFEPFAQAGPSPPPGRGTERIDSNGGAGLGLAITRRLVELQGGRITVESAPGEGSTFTVSLPFLPASPGVGEEAGPAPRGALRGRRYLYVEDTASNREVLRFYLGLEGAEVDLAETGAEGLERFASGDYDAVLVDLQLPDLSGRELASELLRRRPGTRVVAVTAQARDAAPPDHPDPIAAWVPKPVNPDELLQALREKEAPIQPAPPPPSAARSAPEQAERRGLDPAAAGRIRRLAGGELLRAAERLDAAHRGDDPAGFDAALHRITGTLLQEGETGLLEAFRTSANHLREGGGREPGKVAATPPTRELREVARRIVS